MIHCIYAHILYIFTSFLSLVGCGAGPSDPEFIIYLDKAYELCEQYADDWHKYAYCDRIYGMSFHFADDDSNDFTISRMSKAMHKGGHKAYANGLNTVVVNKSVWDGNESDNFRMSLVLHEMGHNFGKGHTNNGGIMDRHLGIMRYRFDTENVLNEFFNN